MDPTENKSMNERFGRFRIQVLPDTTDESKMEKSRFADAIYMRDHSEFSIKRHAKISSLHGRGENSITNNKWRRYKSR